MSVLWAQGGWRAESPGQGRYAFCFCLVSLRQPSPCIGLNHPEGVSQTFLVHSLLLLLFSQQPPVTPADPSFLLVSGVGEVA